MSYVSLPESRACNLGLFCLDTLPFGQKDHTLQAQPVGQQATVWRESRVSCEAQERIWPQSKTDLDLSSNDHSVIFHVCDPFFWTLFALL